MNEQEMPGTVELVEDEIEEGRRLIPLSAVPAAFRSANWLRWALVAGDAVGVLGPLLVTGALVDGLGGAAFSTGGLGRIGILFAFAMTLMASRGLYRSAVASVITFEVASLFSVALRLAVAAVLFDAIAGNDLHLVGTALGAGVTFLVLMMWRSLFRSSLRAARRGGRFMRPLVLVGTDDEAARLHDVLVNHPDAGFSAVGVAGDRALAMANGLGAHWLGHAETAVDLVRSGVASGVLIVPTALPSAVVGRIVRQVRDLGGYVHLSSGLGGLDHRRFRMQPIAHEPLLCIEPTPQVSVHMAMVKRVLDLTIASVGLVVSAPFLALAAIAVKLEDGGPVVFRQRRVGRNGRPFTMYKLRTMVDDAEASVGDFHHLNLRDGPLFKIDDDPRVTRVGRFLRATDLDEVPQLVNVLRGEMSLVGPRPALPSEVAQFDEELRRRTDVPPGLTGLWQVESRHNSSFSAYERLDLFYVENWSVTLDLVIILLTVESKIVNRLGRRPRTEDDSRSGTGAPVPMP